MLFHRYKPYILIAIVFALNACSGMSLNPTHEAKFTFQGKVLDEQGRPVRGAWVKVRGWETLTDEKGQWREEQVVNCGALKDHSDSFEENDAVLVVKEGYAASEEKFIVHHPGWFSGCQPEQVIAFETVLRAESPEKTENREASKYKPKEHPEIPWPTPKNRKRKGTYL